MQAQVQFVGSAQRLRSHVVLIEFDEQGRERGLPPWEASFPWEDWAAPLPKVGDELRLSLEDDRAATGVVTRVLLDLQLPGPIIHCTRTEPLTGSATQAVGA